jgi:hypothetical protein
MQLCVYIAICEVGIEDANKCEAIILPRKFLVPQPNILPF